MMKNVEIQPLQKPIANVTKMVQVWEQAMNPERMQLQQWPEKKQEELYMQHFSNMVLQSNKYSSLFFPKEEGEREKRDRWKRRSTKVAVY